MDELKTQEIEDTLEKICNSETFTNSGRNIRLIKFLVQKALKSEFVKEQVVGFELFEANYDPDDKNSKVRVYMFKLRKKLEEYYSSEGKSDKIKFKIKKGQYNLEFVEEKEKRFHFIERWKGLLVLLIIVLTILFCFYKYNKKQNLWTSFFNSPNETTCFISDQFIAVNKEKTRSYYTYISEVNDETDLNIYQSESGARDYHSANFSYLTKMGPVAVMHLTKLFIKNDNSDFTIELESEFNYDDLKDRNLIFIGQFNTLHQAKSLFLDNSEVFSVKKSIFTYQTQNDTVNYVSRGRTDKSRDYAMVSFRKMDNGNSVVFFASSHDIGVIATVRNFTDSEWLNSFYKQFPKNTTAFNALFEVKGYKRTELECKLERIEYIQ